MTVRVNGSLKVVRVLATELVAPLGAKLGEAPMWWKEHQVLVSVDISGACLFRTDGVSGSTETLSTPSAPGAVAEAIDGGLVVGLTDGLHSIEDWKLVAPIEAEDPTTRVNDCLVDSRGSILVGVMSWDAEPGRSSLYRVSPNGNRIRLLSGLGVSNGMAWMDGELVHIDTPTRLVRSFRYDPEGFLSVPKVLLDLRHAKGVPDGMCMDSKGCLWIALWNGGAVHRYTPSGRLDTVVTVPISRPTSCAFGGNDLSTLYITSAQPSSDDAEEPLAGSLFACDVGVTGAPTYAFGKVQEPR